MGLLANITFYGSMLFLMVLLGMAMARRVWLYRMERTFNRAMNAQDYTGAVEIMNRAIEYSPSTVFYWQSRARAYYEMGSYEAAGKDLTHCLILYQNASLYLDRAAVWLAQDKKDEALIDANHAIACSRNWWKCYFMRARVYFALHHYEIALDDLEQAIEYSSGHQAELRELSQEIRRRITSNGQGESGLGFNPFPV